MRLKAGDGFVKQCPASRGVVSYINNFVAILLPSENHGIGHLRYMQLPTNSEAPFSGELKTSGLTATRCLVLSAIHPNKNSRIKHNSPFQSKSKATVI